VAAIWLTRPQSRSDDDHILRGREGNPGPSTRGSPGNEVLWVKCSLKQPPAPRRVVANRGCWEGKRPWKRKSRKAPVKCTCKKSTYERVCRSARAPGRNVERGTQADTDDIISLSPKGNAVDDQYFPRGSENKRKRTNVGVSRRPGGWTRGREGKLFKRTVPAPSHSAENFLQGAGNG